MRSKGSKSKETCSLYNEDHGRVYVQTKEWSMILMPEATAVRTSRCLRGQVSLTGRSSRADCYWRSLGDLPTLRLAPYDAAGLGYMSDLALHISIYLPLGLVDHRSSIRFRSVFLAQQIQCTQYLLLFSERLWTCCVFPYVQNTSEPKRHHQGIDHPFQLMSCNSVHIKGPVPKVFSSAVSIIPCHNIAVSTALDCHAILIQLLEAEYGPPVVVYIQSSRVSRYIIQSLWELFPSSSVPELDNGKIGFQDRKGERDYLFPFLYHLGHLQHRLSPLLQPSLQGPLSPMSFHLLAYASALDTKPVLLPPGYPLLCSLYGSWQKLLHSVSSCKLDQICLPS